MKIEAIMDAAIDSGLTKRSVKRVAALLEVETVKKKWRLNKEFPGV
jgi:hypothetical protein